MSGKKILVYCPKESLGFSAYMIQELCWAAIQIAGKMSAGLAMHINKPQHSVQLVSATGEASASSSGVTIVPDASIADVEDADVVFLSAFWGSGDKALEAEQDLVPWLQKLAKNKCMIAAISNSPLFLAEAGLLNGEAATIYAPYADEFKAKYPVVDLKLERAITSAGNIYCADGIASSCDMIVLILETLFGPSVAREVERRFLIGFNRSYMVNTIDFDGQKFHQDTKILAAQKWIERHYAQDISIAGAADMAGMSTRNFSRRFKGATGDTPNEYLQRVRVGAAKLLLKNGRDRIIDVSHKVGYTDLGSFNRIFLRIVGETPSEYRKSQLQ
ncbi:GlxA family transcriptional regulator [Kordiimonas laminariae]|uniref:GlxA family transcriptional regulator n=1 Tax=Kordiimonas laminariae TaxID=2917717 RepID=UPI001FF1389F|nr:helix-turn-helix domain-containing protein [Kordiimonas laminariae]MCK0070634.1 helix-turn-helix domain-containing protein [Kordiimonas laminariae]